MHIVTSSILKSLESENWFAALFISLSLPGLCGDIEFTSGNDLENYSKWFDDNLSIDYNGLILGKDCFYLQQALFFKQTDIMHREIIERFHFILPEDSTQKYAHKSLVDGVLQLHLHQFCIDITKGFERWIVKINNTAETQKKLESLSKVPFNLK
tara:strand:- start:94 stop:558 length:465 start_codon:yes stop_codon:yes gene_type:complete